jgi:hypothetical protein
VKVFGNPKPGTVQTPLPADMRMRMEPSVFQAPADCRLVKLTARIAGSTSGLNQVARAFVYDALANLVDSGTEVVVRPNTPPQWIDFLFDEPGGAPIAKGLCSMGLHVGPSDGTILLDTTPYTVTSIYPMLFDNDLYSDGTGPTWATSTGFAMAAIPSLFATYVSPWTPSDEQPLDQLARLPFYDAQQALTTGPSKTSYSGRVGWYGEEIDADIGSFALVSPAGPLAGLVGSRVQVTTEGTDLSSGVETSVVAYVKASAAIIDDIAVFRELFMELAPLAVGLTSPTTHAAARAIRAHIDRTARQHADNSRPRYAIIRSLPPNLNVELADARLVLTDDDVTLGDSVRRYDQEHGLAVGDTLVLVQGAEGQWSAIDVHSARELGGRVGSAVTPASSLAGHSVIGKLRVYDDNGSPVGWVPVYDAIT